MGVFPTLATLALRQVLEGVRGTLPVQVPGEAVQSVVNYLIDRFSDQSQRLPAALKRANDRAWRALEIALAGESLFSWLDRTEDKAFRQQVRVFLDASVEHLPEGDTDYRQRCLRELKAARKAGVFSGELQVSELARQTAVLTRFGSPQELVHLEWQCIGDLAGELEQEGYGCLAEFLNLRSPGHPPLLAVAIRYFFRREIENDPALFRNMTLGQMDDLAEKQQAGFAALMNAFTHHGQLVEEMADGIGEIHTGVLDLQAGQQKQFHELKGIRDLVQGVQDALEQHRLSHRELQPQDSISIRSEGERKLVKQLVAR